MSTCCPSSPPCFFSEEAAGCDTGGDDGRLGGEAGAAGAWAGAGVVADPKNSAKGSELAWGGEGGRAAACWAGGAGAGAGGEGDRGRCSTFGGGGGGEGALGGGGSAGRGGDLARGGVLARGGDRPLGGLFARGDGGSPHSASSASSWAFFFRWETRVDRGCEVSTRCM